jgi:hypothetical protein
MISDDPWEKLRSKKKRIAFPKGCIRGATMTRLIIIGGSAPGISAALRAREIDPSVEPTIVMADRYPNYSICGLLFYLSGEISDWRSLAHRTKEEIEQAGIRLQMGRHAKAIEFAAVLFNDMRVEQLNDFDLSYTPPLSSPWDPVQMAAQAWLRNLL